MPPLGMKGVGASKDGGIEESSVSANMYVIITLSSFMSYLPCPLLLSVTRETETSLWRKTRSSRRLVGKVRKIQRTVASRKALWVPTSTLLITLSSVNSYLRFQSLLSVTRVTTTSGRKTRSSCPLVGKVWMIQRTVASRKALWVPTSTLTS